jgi:hypothetical protein
MRNFLKKLAVSILTVVTQAVEVHDDDDEDGYSEKS